jgi:hypothetical protein
MFRIASGSCHNAPHHHQYAHWPLRRAVIQESTMKKSMMLGTLVSVGLVCAVSAAGPTFRPDAVFSGSSLSGWTPLGAATFRAVNGEIVGSASSGGGWLFLEKSFQDVGLFTNVTCTGACRAGILLRAERTADGFKGVFVSLGENEVASYAIKLDAQGREVSRDRLAQAAGRAGGAAPGGAAAGRGAPAPPANPAAGPPAAGRLGGAAPVNTLPANINLPNLASRPVGSYVSGRVNAVDLTLAKASIAVKLNGGNFGGGGGPTPDEIGSYGRIALYVGAGEARFKDIAYADLNARPFEAEKTSPNFRAQRINEFYYSYSTAVADVNRDGNPDVIAGPYYYLGPSFAVGRELYAGASFNPTSEWPIPSMVQVASDFTGDGWPDVLNMGGNAGNGVGTLYVNPKGENRRWTSHAVVQPVGNEETLLKDIDGDGKPELIHSGNNTLRYSKPDPQNPTGTWITTTISEPGPWGANIGHGMGVGDINGDGLADYTNPYGWWQQPPRGSAQTLWTFHPVEFGRWGASQGGAGGAEMGIYDVNGDKLNDVVTALEGHGFGLAWYEQKRSSTGAISFVRHMIMDGFLDQNAGGVTFTQPHASTFGDINRDGITDFIVGKRHHSHFQYADPDNWGSPVLYVYTVVRDPKSPGGARFVPELVHNKSGVGSHFDVVDLNKDGWLDIATSSASGTFVFFNQRRAATAR